MDEDTGVDIDVDEVIDDALSDEQKAPEDDEDETPDSGRSIH